MTALLAVIDALGVVGAAGLLVLLGNHLRLMLASRRFRDPPPSAFRFETRPSVLVQIPVFDEPGSVEGALAAAAALTWPRERLEIQLLDDSTDETSALASAAISRLNAPIRHVRRSGRAGFKAGALAHGLELSDAEFVAILDADFRAPPEWISRCVAVLVNDPHAGFVQSRFEFRNAGAGTLTGLQQMLADTHFCIEQAGRAACGEILPFNGTSALWRRAAIDAAGGWSGDTLAEDLDLSVRAHLVGWRAQLLLDPPVIAEAVADLQAWGTQQRRWSRGFVQVARGLLAPIWRSAWPLRRKLQATLMVGQQAALPCAALAILALVADAALRGPGRDHVLIAGLAALIFGGSALLLTWLPFRRLRRGTTWDYVRIVVGLPVLLLGLVAFNAGAVLTALSGRSGAFVRTPKRGDRPSDNARR